MADKDIKVRDPVCGMVVKTVPGTVSAYSERVVGDRYVAIDIDRLALVLIPAVFLLWKEYAPKHSTEARENLRET